MAILKTLNCTFVLIFFLCSQNAFSQQDYQELQVITTGPGTSGQYFKHVFLFTKIIDQKRLTEIGVSYQSKFSEDIIFVYFCDDKDNVSREIPYKTSEWEHVLFRYNSNPFTGSKQLVDWRPITAELKKVGPSFQGGTDSQKEFARSFYDQNKSNGILAVQVAGLFMDVTVDKKTGDELLINRMQAEKRLKSWHKDFQDFSKRDGQNFYYAGLITVICEGDEIITLDHRGIKFH